ncbi:Zinc finger MYM-type protein 3 [Vespula squamosa]|uniref:Zinc finger MYM-type protein 3 n=1 Tax=Vespula squamosa TaxID=30214 RepID=A0ABD2BRV5_VESSQ
MIKGLTPHWHPRSLSPLCRCCWSVAGNSNSSSNSSSSSSCCSGNACTWKGVSRKSSFSFVFSMWRGRKSQSGRMATILEIPLVSGSCRANKSRDICDFCDTLLRTLASRLNK